MPNTLTHIGLQTIICRKFVKPDELRWVVLGAFLPDLPWIIRKVLGGIGEIFDPYILRLYAITQSSLIFCVILSLSVTLVSNKPYRYFFITSVSCLIHLLLDSIELKYSAGVFLFVPYSWVSIELGVLSTSGVISISFTIVGFIVALFLLFSVVTQSNRIFTINCVISPFTFNSPRILITFVLLLFYLSMPLLLVEKAKSANVGSIATLINVKERAGKTVWLDRERLIVGDDAKKDVAVRTFAREDIRVQNLEVFKEDNNRRISGVAEFISEDLLEFREVQIYRGYWRDLASYLGLLIFILFWVFDTRKVQYSNQG